MSAVLLLLRKDLRILRRSPLLLGALLAYPIVIALLVGLVAGYASAKPRVAFVDRDHLPAVVAVGGHRFHLKTVIDQVAQQVTLVRLGPKEAARELADGKVVATITVPPGFLSNLVDDRARARASSSARAAAASRRGSCSRCRRSSTS